MNKRIDEEQLKETITALFESIVADKAVDAIAITNLADVLKETYKNISGPENFNCLFVHEIEHVVDAVAEQFYSKTENIVKDKYKPTFIFTHYSFLERHIEQLVIQKERLSCSADKSRHILNKYFKYSLTGEIDEFDMKKGNYWVPKFGSAKQWMEFCDSLYQLYYGKVKDFVINYDILLKEEVRRYEYDAHKWFIEFTNGKIIHLATHYDQYNKDPVDVDRFEGLDHFIIADSLLGDYAENFEIAAKEELTEVERHMLCVTRYRIVPKNLIERINFETEKVII